MFLRLTMLRPGVGEMDNVMASIPLTVLVPVANKLVKNSPLLARESICGVMFNVLPNEFKNLPLKLSMQTKIILGFKEVFNESEFVTVLNISFLSGCMNCSFLDFTLFFIMVKALF